MTRANERARVQVRDAERRAKQKLRRLENKGVRVGSISPIKKVDLSDTWAAKRYAKELNKFVEREQRFIAGQEGSPLLYKEFSKLKKLEKAYNKKQLEFWEEHGSAPILTVAGSVSSVAERAEMLKHGIPRFKKPSFKMNVKPEQIKSKKQLERMIKQVELEINPRTDLKRLKNARFKLALYAEKFDEPLARKIRALTNKQLMVLLMQTDFEEVLNSIYPDDYVAVDGLTIENQLTHLHNLIAMSKQVAPRKQRSDKGKKRKK